MKTLSIIIPNYNDGHLLEAALSRTCSQTRPATEIIVVDDGSTDNSLDVITDFKSRNPTVRCIAQGCNKGALSACLRGFEAATGDYIYFSACDDGIGPKFVEKLLDLAETYPQAGLVCSDVEIRYAGASQTVQHGFVGFPGYLPPQSIATVLQGRNIMGAGTIYRRDVIIASRLFDYSLRWHADWFASLVMAFRHGIAVLPEVHSFIGHRADSMSNRGRNVWAEQSEVVQRIFELVGSAEFRDILPHFIWSRAFDHFGADAARAILQNPRLMTGVNSLLARTALAGVKAQ